MSENILRKKSLLEWSRLTCPPPLMQNVDSAAKMVPSGFCG